MVSSADQSSQVGMLLSWPPQSKTKVLLNFWETNPCIMSRYHPEQFTSLMEKSKVAKWQNRIKKALKDNPPAAYCIIAVKSLPRASVSAISVLSWSPLRNMKLSGRPRQGCAPCAFQQALPSFSRSTFPAPHQDVLCLVSYLPHCTVGNNLTAKHAQLLSHLLSFENGVTQWHKTTWENKRHLPQQNLIIQCFQGDGLWACSRDT